MGQEHRKKRIDIMIPNHKVKENILLRSLPVKSLFWIIAGAIPRSLKIPKKEIKLVAIATIPNYSGAIKRANIPVTTREIIIPEYLDMAVYNTPDINSFFMDAIVSFVFIGMIWIIKLLDFLLSRIAYILLDIVWLFSSDL